MKQRSASATVSPEASHLSPLPPAVVAPVGGWRYALALLICLYVVLAGIHATVVPVGNTGYQNAPDEAAHVAYVWSVASGHLPTHSHPTPYTSEPVANGYEWHQPPLYYALMAPLSGLGERGMRVGSILLGVACLLLIYRSGRTLLPGDPAAAILATGIAALIPTHIAITSTVNNDVLLEVCFSGSLLVMLTALMQGFSRSRAIWLGIALSAALLTKLTGLLLLPVSGFCLLLLWRNGVRRTELLKNCGLTFSLFLLLTGWWFVRNLALYGQLLPLRLFAEEFAHTAQAADCASRVGGWTPYLVQMSLGTFMSFWAVNGTAKGARLGIPSFLPDQIYLLVGGISLLAGVGLARLHFQRRTLFTTEQLHGLWVLFLTIALVGLAYLAFILRYFQMQGRYMFPAMLPICLVFALAFRSVFPERWKPTASLFLLGLLGCIDMVYLRYLMP